MTSSPATPEIFIESVSDLAGAGETVRECYAYWQGLCAAAGGGLPRRSMIDPSAIPSLLPNFRLIDLFENGELMPRYRLVGTAGRDVMGIDPGASSISTTRIPMTRYRHVPAVHRAAPAALFRRAGPD